MKRYLIGIIIGVMISGTASAAGSWMATQPRFTIKVDDKVFTNDITPAMVINGSTYLPLKAIATALKTTAVWDNASRTVYVGSRQVDFPMPSGLVVGIKNHGRFYAGERANHDIAVDMALTNTSTNAITVNPDDFYYGDQIDTHKGELFESLEKTITVSPGETKQIAVVFHTLNSYYLLKNELPYKMWYSDPTSKVLMKYYY